METRELCHKTACLTRAARFGGSIWPEGNVPVGRSTHRVWKNLRPGIRICLAPADSLKRRREVLTVRRTGVIAEIGIVRLPWRHHGIEQRAAEIEDPLERLRYLRQTVGQPDDSIRVFKWQLPLDFWRTRGTWIVLSLAVLTAVAWRPGHSTSRAANIARPALQRPGLNPAVAGSVAGVLSPHAVWLVETRNGLEI